MDLKTKVRGVTQSNENGAARQKIIARLCREGDMLEARPEPDNRFDSKAIGLWAGTGRRKQKIGYLSAEVAEAIAGDFPEGATIAVSILNVTGGGAGEFYGVNIALRVASSLPRPAADPARAYLKKAERQSWRAARRVARQAVWQARRRAWKAKWAKLCQDRGVEPGPLAWYRIQPPVGQAVTLGVGLAALALLLTLVFAVAF